MKKKAKKGRGVSRREFLKGLGGGAVGAAVISAGLLKPDRAEGVSAAGPVRRKVSAQSKEVKVLEDFLAKDVLPDIQKVAGQEEVLITCRLNEPDKKYPAPTSYAWVESPKLADRRKSEKKIKGDPHSRFIGSTHNSPIYTRCLTHNTNRAYVHEIDYSKPGRESAEKTPGAQKLDTAMGLNHRRFVAIIAKNQRVGTLTAGFPKPPANNDELKKRLVFLAQNDQSLLVQHLLKSGIGLGGPEI